VEAALSVSPYVDNIMIHADPFHSYCVALVVAAHNELENWALQQGVKYSDFSDLCQKQEAVKEVLGCFAKVCVLYSHRWISCMLRQTLSDCADMPFTFFRLQRRLDLRSLRSQPKSN
jgi:hypothetical protein